MFWLLFLTWVALAFARESHITLPDEIVEGKRVVVLGDVHGCYEEMIKLLQNEDLVTNDLQTIKDDAVVIFAGDIINKGPLNIEVLRFVKNSGAYVVTGNHEVNIVENPGKYDWTDELTSEEWSWVSTLPYTVTIPLYNTIVVHAGLLPDTALDDQTVFVMTRMRNIEVLPDGTMIPYDDRDKGENWANFWTGPDHACYGHDAGRGKDDNGNPIIQWHDLATGLDSRCVYGGLLSAVYLPVTDQPQVAQVQCEEYDKFTNDKLVDLY